ncbi:membrane protein [Marivirga lumbricoides]|uniref:Membrane protein n=1 Tax=Marivirga lumbricoides TaxID=1046115 RepID=A0ABQ1N1J2_9BACT|nr:membrane protein [Marivirga lumbricoides]
MTIQKLAKGLLIGSIAVFWQACGSDDKEVKQSNIEYSEALAQEISFVTNGDVHFDDEIKVIFNTDVIEESEIDSSPADVFDFDPDIDGKAVWKSRSVLQFITDEGLPIREQISGTLNLQKLSARFKEIDLEDLKFYLNVLGREISDFNAQLKLKDRNDPKILIYKGTISFTEKTDIEILKEEASLKGEGSPKLSWSKIDDKTFQFISDDITRTDGEATYDFKIENDELELEEVFTAQFVLVPLKEMRPVEVKAEEAGKKPRIRINFSDELDMEQNIDGLVSVSPTVKFEAKKLGSTIILDGDFKFGTSYEVNVKEGLRSKWGTKTVKAFNKQIQFSNIAPQLEFASDGIILPSSNNKKIQFYTTNLKRVHLEVKKIFTEKVGQFIESEQLASTKTRNQGFNDSYSSTIGVIIKNQSLEIGKEKDKNEWLLNEFDLSELFTNYQDGIYLIRINFTPEDLMIPVEGDKLSYIQEKGQIYKPVFLSDIGMTLKITDNDSRVFVTDLVTAKPLSNVRVSLLDYYGDEVESVKSNSEGVAYFSSDRYFYHVIARNGNDISALKKNDMRWSNSGFDIGGVNESYNNTKGFIYTERGVYRPGDSVHVSFIARNSNKTFPKDHPVTINVRDPEYNIIYEQTKVKSTDGFYVFGFNTSENAPTGNYSINIQAGGSYFSQPLKIETVVAEKLKVVVNPEKKTLSHSDKTINYAVEANYLFGAPAASLKAEVDVEVIPYEKSYPKYKDYTFTRADIEYKSFTKNILKTTLGADGKVKAEWVLPAMGSVPSMLKAKLNAKVLEKGGMPNEGWNIVNIEPYPYFVGLMDPSGYGYYKTGEEVRFPVVLLDSKGDKISGKKLYYKVYRNDKNWWYQYDSRRNYQLKYKEDSQTYLETEGSITTQSSNNTISFNPAENGEYLIEVSEGENGHIASMFFSAYRYGSVPGGDLNEGNLALKSDKESYKPGETAKIKLPNPQQGNMLMTIEKGGEMLSWKWIKPSGNTANELTLEVPVTREMLPNAYVTVSVIQPHDQTMNDRPIRTFGILPIMVIDPSTKIEFEIKAAKNLVPNKTFEVEISTINQQQAQFSIAVVDEGLLSLTQFRTPQPWDEFFKKTGLFVQTYDIFSHVISANKGDVFQTFSIGGDEALDYRESQIDPVNGKKRFKPVSMFKGPLMTDSRGKATVQFDMPNYNGAVRVMVVGASGNSYGSADKTIPVRSDIILQPTIPRLLNPGDEFILPVSLFKINPDIKTAQFKLALEGPLEVIGNNSASVNFSQKEEADISFKVRVKEAIGQAKISILGTAGNIKINNETDIKVVPTSTRVYDKSTKKVAKGQSVSISIPALGLEGTNNATLDLNIFPDMDFDHRLKWLIRYPYGCIEQTTSAVFPQLTLKQMGYFRKDEISEIDKNINEAILRLQQFVLSSGAFSYWPGQQTPSEWGSNYATHFLIEARKAGYSVPDYLYNNAISNLDSDARNHSGKLTTRVYRTFILALANRAPVGEMNLIMENSLPHLSNAEKWMLAAAYHLKGVENVKTTILNSAGTETKEYDPFSYSYGSKYRDNAIILYAATLMEDMETAELMAKSVASTLSGKEYLSTQSSGYMLLALGKYFEKAGISMANGQVITGKITLANGQTIDFNEEGRYTIPIKDNFGKSITVELTNASNAEQIYATVSYNGVPLKDQSVEKSKNLGLEVSWYDRQGKTINPQSLKQGDTFYGRFTVSNESPISNVSEIALVQIFPSGWQIENTRLNNEMMPDWTNSWNLNKEDYLDLRDDRAMWFFDLANKEKLDFIVKLNCVTAGEFWLPGTLTEAMYNNDFKASKEGKKVVVAPFK